MSKKVDVKALTFPPVPPGLRMRYKHFYDQSHSVVYDEQGKPQIKAGPKKLFATKAWLEHAETREIVFGCEGIAMVSKKDTPIKKLGRYIAHTRAIAAWNEGDL